MLQATREPDSAATAIELAHVHKSFARARQPSGAPFAVHDVSLRIPAGQFVAIVGGSGSGKTTTLKCINALLRPERGEVSVQGRSVNSVPGHVLRRSIGYVFQGVGLFPHLNVAENIGVTPQLLGWPRDKTQARVVELLELVALPAEYATRMPAALSGGQRQRVGLARALAAGPRIMLMDEPFGALDPLTRDALGREYRKLHEQMQLTTVMVTHDILEAVLLADRIVVMSDGAIVADDTPRALFRDADGDVRTLMDMPRQQALRVSALLAETDGARGEAGQDG
jgi:osmoprotectant transport system ATP-binding protein